MKKQRPVTIFMKPTDYCNVGCEHCYLPTEIRANKLLMTEDIFQSSIKSINDMVKKQNASGASIIWHGGEPLSLPVDYLTKLVSAVDKQIPNSLQSIQTSLIPYSNRWKSLIDTYFGGEIGSSIDFSQRLLKGSSKTYKDFWLKKVNMARKDNLHIIPGIVPSRKEIGQGDQITTWLYNNNFKRWNIDRYNQYSGLDPQRPNNKEHSLFLTEIFNSIMKYAQQGKFIYVNTVSAAITGIVTGQPGERWGSSCSHDFLVINPDGSTNACPDKISFETFSNINDGFTGYQQSKERKKWVKYHMTGHNNQHCGTCSFNIFCKSGCPLTSNNIKEEKECSGYVNHLLYVKEYVKNNYTLITEYMDAIS